MTYRALAAGVVWSLLSGTEPSAAFAQPPIVNAEARQPRLHSLTVRHFETRGGALRPHTIEHRLYNSEGFLIELRYTRGSWSSRTLLTWNEHGDVASREMRESSGRIERREFTYRRDEQGRIVERTLRDPRAPAGEEIRSVYSYGPDGSYTVVDSRHYAREGPYRGGVATYDAAGRLEMRCSESGYCSMVEYDPEGQITRIRQQTGEEHHYLDYDTQYGPDGRIVRQQIGGVVHEYRYDSEGNLIESTESIADEVQSRDVYSYRWR